MISLVGHNHGRKIIRWGYVIFAFLLITIGAGLVGLCLYAILTGRWNPSVLWIGPLAGVLVTTLSVLVSFRTPPQRLPFLKQSHLP